MKTTEMILMKWVDSSTKIELIKSRIEILSLALHGYQDDLGYQYVFREMVDKIENDFEGLIKDLENAFEDLRSELKDKDTSPAVV